MKPMRSLEWAALFCALTIGGQFVGQNQSRVHAVIIDMHVHAYAADANGSPPLGLCIPVTSHLAPLDPARQTFSAVSKHPPCSDPIWSPITDEAVMEQTIAVLKQRNMIGVLSGPPDRVLKWSKAAPGRFIPSVEFRLGPDQPSVHELRGLFKSGRFAVLGEVLNQYAGIAPNDVRMEPYWALAELLDIPVAIHMGEGPPGAGYLVSGYRAQLTSPYLLEDVLKRHPRLRISIMHYGSPLIEETIAMLGAYPQLYVDIGGIQWNYPRPYFYKQLKELIDAGFSKRIMFGSDQMNWPGLIEPAIAIVEQARFLNQEQKHDILCRNAARFLRLDAGTCP